MSVRELAEDLMRRSDSAFVLAHDAVEASDRERLNGKGHAYKHAAELAITAWNTRIPPSLEEGLGINSSLPPTPMPTGKRLVPEEPTDEQVSRGMVAAQMESVDKPFLWGNAVRAAYEAMLDAAPLPAEPSPRQPVPGEDGDSRSNELKS